MHMVHSLILGIYITRVMILGSPRVLITNQCSPRPFNCDIATIKVFYFLIDFLKQNHEVRCICVLCGNVAFGKNFIPHADTCQSAIKSLRTIKTSANRVLPLSKPQEAASLKCIILSGMYYSLAVRWIGHLYRVSFLLECFPRWDTRVSRYHRKDFLR